MIKHNSILVSFLAGALLFSGCDKTESDFLPADPGKIALRNDYFSTTINTPVELDILANDTITTTASLTIQQPQNGHLVADSATGLYLYVPHGTQQTEEEITYTVCKNGDCKTATVKIKVMDVGQCVVKAVTDKAVSDFPHPVTIENPLANDHTCGRVVLELPQQLISGGTASLHPNGRSLVFTPTDPVIGTARFFYRICGSSGCDTAWVNVKVNPPITQNCNFFTRPDFIPAYGMQVGDVKYITVTNNDNVYGCGSAPSCQIYQHPLHGQIVYDSYYGDQYIFAYKRTDSLSYSDILMYQVCKIINGEMQCREESVTIQFDEPYYPE